MIPRDWGADDREDGGDDWWVHPTDVFADALIEGAPSHFDRDDAGFLARMPADSPGAGPPQYPRGTLPRRRQGVRGQLEAA